MTPQILYGQPVADAIRSRMAEDEKKLGRKVRICAIGFASNAEWRQYSASLERSADIYGAEIQNIYLDDDFSPQRLFDMLDGLSSENGTDAVLLQQPLPEPYRHAVLHIHPDKDADGLTARNLQSLFCNKETLVPATPQAVVEILDHYGVDLCGKNAVIVGRGVAVGKPLSLLLLNRNATVTVCHTKTQNLDEITRRADVLISCSGHAGLITAKSVRKGAVVVDVGLSFVDGKARGDVLFEEVSPLCSVTPVPRGVGPVTRACLFANAYKAAFLRK